MPKRKVYPPYENRPAAMGCWVSVLVLAVVGWTAVVFRTSLAGLAVLLTVPFVLLAWHQINRWSALRVGQSWLRRGIRGVLVYSRSPNWQTYIEESWLPRIQDRLYLLNWSDRKSWRTDDPAVRVFKEFLSGDIDSNPSAVLFRPALPPLVFSFYAAYKNAKHGRTEDLRRLEMQFFEELERSKNE